MLPSATRGETLTPNPNECNSTLTSGTNNIYPTPIYMLMIGVTAYELPTCTNHLQLKAKVVRGKMFQCRPVKAPQKCTLPSCPSVSSEDGELPLQVEYRWFRNTQENGKLHWH